MFKQKTMADYIYNEIRDAIVFIEYMPGEKISETQLAQKYNVSRSPVRRALALLERDGLVVIKPQSGTIVSEISFKRAQEMQEIRNLLEPYAIKIAAPKITDEQLNALQACFDRLAQLAPESEERRRYVTEVDFFMHDIILECCGNKEIEKIIKSFRPILKRVNMANLQWRNRLIPVEKEMREIFAALKARDPQKAYQAMLNHMAHVHIGPTKVAKNKEEE